jgi:hypothetical protein
MFRIGLPVLFHLCILILLWGLGTTSGAKAICSFIQLPYRNLTGNLLSRLYMECMLPWEPIQGWVTTQWQFKWDHLTLSWDLPQKQLMHPLFPNPIPFKNQGTLQIFLSSGQLAGHTTLTVWQEKLQGIFSGTWQRPQLSFSGQLAVKTPQFTLRIAPQLSLHYLDSILKVQGTIQVLEAKIQINPHTTPQYTLPTDVVFIDQNHPSPAQNIFKIEPDIFIRFEDHVTFQGYGLIDAALSGKLHITERSDGILIGQGRITIKKGKYRLQGATRHIDRGRLLFPAGTILQNPILDIRILQHNTQNSADHVETGIYIQGTLQKPSYQLYSNAQLSDEDIAARLGFGQSALFLADSANKWITQLQTQLGLDALNLESRDTDTVLILGKPISKHLYLQYLQSIEDMGVDLTFFIEKN